MRLIAHVACSMRVSVPPQLGGPDPVGASIEPDVSRINTTYGLRGSPAYAGLDPQTTTSMATPSHANSFLMRPPFYVGAYPKGNARRVALGVAVLGGSRATSRAPRDRRP